MLRKSLKSHFIGIFIRLGWASLLLFVLSACASPKFTYGTFESGDGSITMHLQPDGTFSIYNHTQLLDQGTFSIQGTQFTWETSSACDPGGKATYTWTYQNATLVLKVSGADPCSHRQAGINGLEYRLKP
ncbi:MAG TPA: hypothetical protein VK249_08595 [Anaerolineales bacterium]|nr:hypothetical protein [Anaerolineales bacterium]